ncbi:type II secretion system protein GspG [Cystobacter fuscus]|uniref:type II secretion system protein GspG n=1 Tax=Cystobacter fuscus TaxID=43 RepID=UPI0037BEEFB6
MEFLRRFLSFAGPLSFFLTVLIMMFLARVMHHGPEKHETAALDLRNIQKALKRCHSMHQRYPSTEEGLQAILDILNLEQVPRDPWGHPYRYELREGRPWVWSLGADGAPGGEDEDADVFPLEAH